MSVEANMLELRAAAWEILDEAHWSYIDNPSERELKITIFKGKTFLSTFSLSFLPGCKKIIVFHGVTVDPQYRNQGYGSILHRLRLDIAKQVGAELVLCTVLVGNSVEKRILEKNEWTKSHDVAVGVEMWSRVI